VPDDDDEEATLVACPKCGGDRRLDCTLCGGHGSVKAAVAANYRFEQAARIARKSGTYKIKKE
jgi:hypothetical protein